MGAITLKEYNGFTLMELMVVVAVVGILTAIALPSYSRYVLRSHRIAAINAILDLASREARYFTTNNSYTGSLTDLGYASDPMPVTIGDSSSTYYNLKVRNNTATTFILEAAPTGQQQDDTCGAYTYTDLGVKGIDSGTLSDCWKQ